MGTILVYSERDDLAYELISQARRFQAVRGRSVAAALLGDPGDRAADFFAYGADRVFAANHPTLTGLRPEPVSAALAQIADSANADTVLVDSTRRGKELAPRLAQKLGAGCVTDAVAVRWENEWRADRSALGGNTVATDRIVSPRAVIAVMPKVFERGAKEARSGEVAQAPVTADAPPVRVVETRPKGGAGTSLDDAEIVIGIGRGFAKQEDLALAQALAEALGGEVGCSRTLATDFHWLGEDRMIGLSGKRLKPRLYLAIGISGQIQHTVGITGAKLIAAINSDKEAPIFEMADYGIVGDLYQVVPALTAKVRK
ncbi:MAG: electron transfer flavoprotein subunit alpha/FixB family protein [Chloroflexi bacterium]|nr:electron transfer flavoprotein subunit alpha/FixB family protein [Chloroflexota bacterium]